MLDNFFFSDYHHLILSPCCCYNLPSSEKCAKKNLNDSAPAFHRNKHELAIKNQHLPLQTLCINY